MDSAEPTDVRNPGDAIAIRVEGLVPGEPYQLRLAREFRGEPYASMLTATARADGVIETVVVAVPKRKPKRKQTSNSRKLKLLQIPTPRLDAFRNVRSTTM